MSSPRPVFLVALRAAVVIALGSLAVPRVAAALPRARAVVPAAREALAERSPEAARALGISEAAEGAPVAPVAPAAAGDPAPPGPAAVEVAGFSVPDFAALRADAAPARAAAGGRALGLPSLRARRVR